MASDAISMQVTVDGTSTGQHLRGPEVTGNVAITVHEAIKYHSIEVVIVCQSTVKYVNIIGTTELLPEEQTGSLAHLFEKIVLKKSDSDAQEELAPGAYNFPFTFTVTKENLPSTFVSPGLEGSGVAYYVESLVLPEKDATEAIARKFTYFPFIGTVDIGDALLKPIRRQKRRGVGCLCFVSNPVTLTVQLERGGFCVGETMKVNVTVTNGSDEDVQVNTVLERVIHHDVRTPVHRHRKKWNPEIVTGQDSGTIGPLSTFDEGFDLVIPESGPVTMSLHAAILQVYYELIVRVDIPNAVDIEVKIPIIVGCKNSHQDT